MLTSGGRSGRLARPATLTWCAVSAAALVVGQLLWIVLFVVDVHQLEIDADSTALPRFDGTEGVMFYGLYAMILGAALAVLAGLVVVTTVWLWLWGRRIARLATILVLGADLLICGAPGLLAAALQVFVGPTAVTPDMTYDEALFVLHGSTVAGPTKVGMVIAALLVTVGGAAGVAFALAPSTSRFLAARRSVVGQAVAIGVPVARRATTIGVTVLRALLNRRGTSASW